MALVRSGPVPAHEVVLEQVRHWFMGQHVQWSMCGYTLYGIVTRITEEEGVTVRCSLFGCSTFCTSVALEVAYCFMTVIEERLADIQAQDANGKAS
jgi:hypothetical protein